MAAPNVEQVPANVEESDATRQVRQESLAYLPGKLVRALMGALTLPILAIWFLPADIGRYDLSIRFVDFLYTICALWLGTVIVRFYSMYEHRRQLPAYLNVVGLVQLGGIAIGLGLLFLTRWLGPESVFGSYRTLLDVAAPMFIGYTMYETGLMMLRARSQAFTYSLSSMASAFGRILVGLALAYKFGISGMLWGVAIVNTLIYFFIMRSSFARVRFSLTPVEKDFLREVLIYGLPLCLNSTIAFLLGNGDRYMLKYALGPELSDKQVGLFAVGSLFAEQPLAVIYSTLMLAVFPAASRIYDRQGRAATETFNQSETRIYLLVATPLTVLIAVYARNLFALFPAKFEGAYQVMPWVAVGAFLIGLSQYPSQGLLITKRTRWIFVVNMAAVLLNLCTNWFLIPRLGFVACGVARVAASGFLVMVMAVITASSLTWRVSWLSVMRLGIAAAAMVFVSHQVIGWWFPAHPHLIVGLMVLSVCSLLDIAVFVVALILLGELRLSELVREFKRR